MHASLHSPRAGAVLWAVDLRPLQRRRALQIGSAYWDGIRRKKRWNGVRERTGRAAEIVPCQTHPSEPVSALFFLFHGGDVEADGNCLFTTSQKAIRLNTNLRDLRRRTVQCFIENYEAAEFWDLVMKSIDDRKKKEAARVPVQDDDCNWRLREIVVVQSAQNGDFQSYSIGGIQELGTLVYSGE